MRKIIILLSVLLAAISAYSQTYVQDGDRCFQSSDYTCAEFKYKEAFKLAKGEDRQIAEIKLTRAKWCAEHIKAANQAFTNKNYKEAKENYESVLDSNPNDTHAKGQLTKCKNYLTPPATTLSLSKENVSFSSSGGNESITVNTNASLYTINPIPSWCSVQKYVGYFVFTCNNNSGSITRTGYVTVTAGNRTAQIYISQTGRTKVEASLTVSTQNISFIANGGRLIIDVNTNVTDYKIAFLPSWCRIDTKNINGFALICYPNFTSQSRTDWFQVTAGGKEVKIYVNQTGATNTTTQNSSSSTSNKKSTYSYYKKTKSCFNCPKTKDTWGITAGYIQKSLYYTDGIQLGLRIEPLFKYGFGLNTGLNFEGYYSTNLMSIIKGEEDFEQYALNVPLHLEYRLNFSKWFNIFAYGGAGLNVLTDRSFGNYSTLFTAEYGGGLRINHIQFNVGQNAYLERSYQKNPKKLILSFSYMF